MARDAVAERGRIVKLVERWEREDVAFARSMGSGVDPGQALARLGVRLCLQERYEEAVSVLRVAATARPDDWLILNQLAVVLDRAQEVQEAIGTAHRSLAMKQDQPEVWIHLGNMLKSVNDLAGAEHAYHTALEFEPTSAIAWQLMGLVKQQQRQFRKAIACFLKSANLGNATAPIFAILGQLFHQVGEFDKSLHAYSAAAEMEPENQHFRSMRAKVGFLADVMASTSVDTAVENYFRNVTPDEPWSERNTSDILQNAYSLLSGYGHIEAAARVGQKLLELEPQNATAAYLLKALKGDRSVLRSPDDYLVEHFDAFAQGFDRQLTTVLGYSVPEQLGEMARAHIGSRKLDVLDVGCGTGLCGVHIGSVARGLTGVDLSPKMLAIAQDRGLYTELHCEEITSYMRRMPGSADLLLAADVLIYFGDLAPIFEAFAHALRAGGLLAISVERRIESDFQLLPSGRFAHDPAYVRTLAQEFGFTECNWRDITIRLEAASPVQGDLFLFRRED
ncbi:MAG TPA: methyltransferase domain-containing protein [Phycisphaerae bacterium]|nr:methyltransferase domain-containing protein [Phycisphaerae bacterium]